MKGELEGTLFDSQKMTAGMPAWVASQIQNNEHMKGIFTNLSSDFKSRVLFKSNSGGRISYLYVIMDTDSGSYYVVWKG